ncbi:hypothetical protein F5B20DRAFT_546495 [Whalleya microplaca]|nr:hypothetical protein F5B20DRAFT_546495 [Whalleya microplaca]
MAEPWIPRMHLFEIDDQPWFPPFLRAYVQTGLTHAWTVALPPLQQCSPATLVANTLRRVLGASVSAHTYIDFCAGAGGPTPFIEQALNAQLLSPSPHASPEDKGNGRGSSVSNGAASPSYAAVASTPKEEGVRFVLTDLHPHVEAWEAAARQSAHLTYVPEPVDAANAPPDLLKRYGENGNGKGKGKGVFRLFNLAFHHFDDGLARAILRNTVETSDGFGIFELQDRTFSGFLTCGLFGIFILLVAPFLYWWSPARLFYIYLLPIVPFVLVFDGVVSCLRTRTPDEVEVLLRTCGADTDDWTVQSGRERHLWPCGYLNWIICTKRKQ